MILNVEDLLPSMPQSLTEFGYVRAEAVARLQQEYPDIKFLMGDVSHI